MPETLINVENLGKRYRLGVINRGMLYKDIQSWWAKIRGLEDPNQPVLGQARNDLQGSEFWAFRNVNFRVAPGEIVGIIGRNGAGKSTLLKVLSQITAPTEGRIHIRGKVASLLEVGTGFHGELTGRENIYLNGAILGLSRSEVRKNFDEIVSFAEVDQFIDTPVKRYSSGMYVRLAFAVAAHLEPDVLIVDEVLAVGDAAFRQKCLAKMDSVAKQHGRAVLFVSHNMEAVRSLCGRGILLHWGQLVMDGPVVEVLERYIKIGGENHSDAFGEGRDGSGRMRFQSLQLLDDAGHPQEIVPTGQPVEFVLSYKNHALEKGERFSVGLSVHTTTSDLLSNYSHFQGIEFTAGGAEGKIRVKWPSADLVPGRYFIGFLAISRNGSRRGEVLDKTGPIQLEVCPADYFGTGHKVTEGMGSFLCRLNWRSENSSQ